MKNLGIILFVLAGLNASAQDFTLTFNGVDNYGSPIELDSVQIYNLQSNEQIVIAGNSYNLENPNAISLQTVLQNEIHTYPNPFYDETSLLVPSEFRQKAVISAFSIDGRLLASYTGELNEGLNHFKFFSAEKGMIILTVQSAKFFYGQKILCLGNAGQSKFLLAEVSVNRNSKNQKSSSSPASEEFDYNTGDRLRFVGFSGSLVSLSVYDIPQNSKQYTLQFTDGYYTLTNQLLTTSLPSFVNILFSVENRDKKGIDYLTTDHFEVYEDDAPVSPSETFMYVRKSRSAPFTLKTVLLLDNSASVGSNLDAIKQAALNLVQNKLDNQQFAIYSFSSSPVLEQDFTDDIDTLEKAINEIGLGFPSTNLYGSVIEGLSRWQDYYSPGRIEQGYLVVFTDGDDTQGTSSLSEAIGARGNKKTYIIGLGNEINPGSLSQLANPGPYYSIADIEELDQVFEEIQNDIIRQSNSFYWLSYMSPKRSGIHNIRLQLKENENVSNTSYIEGNFSAAEFTDVTYGVYVNTSPEMIYGIEADTIDRFKCWLKLTATSYWASQPPEYTWSETGTNRLRFRPDPVDPYSVWVTAVGEPGSSSEIRVFDNANSFSNSIDITLKESVFKININSVTRVGSSPGTYEVNSLIINYVGFTVIQKGVVWNLSGNPSISSNAGITHEGPDGSAFTSLLENLLPGTVYYTKAYAITEFDTVYSPEFSFETQGLASVLSSPVNGITATSALSGGNISDDAGYPVTERGVCFNTIGNPTVSDPKTNNGSGLDSFSSELTGLNPGTTYYLRAYATNSVGTAYGEELFFTTLDGLPSVTTAIYTDLTATSAISGGTVNDDGGFAVTARGICWSTSPEPNLTDSKTVDGSGTGSFVSTVSGLSVNATYYLRAYATNAIGTSYGEEINFTTQDGLPLITTSYVSDLAGTLAKSGGTVESDGGFQVTSRGICWSTSPNPTLGNNTTNDGSGTGEYISNLTGLLPETVYYIKAYAVNINGVAYGNEIIFGYGQVADIDGNVYKTIRIGDQWWMAENLATTTYNNGNPITHVYHPTLWKVLTSEGYSWYNDSISNKNLGALYNAYVVATNNVCPTSWHIPSDQEWKQLEMNLGLSAAEANTSWFRGTVEGDMLKMDSNGWAASDSSITNAVLFNAIPAGWRSYTNGYCVDRGGRTYWWSSTSTNSTTGLIYMARWLQYGNSGIARNGFNQQHGYSIRCVKDN